MASRLRLRLDIVVAIGLSGIGAYLWRSPGLHWLGVGCVVVSSLFAIILVAAFTIIPRFTPLVVPARLALRPSLILFSSPNTADLHATFQQTCYGHATLL